MKVSISDCSRGCASEDSDIPTSLAIWLVVAGVPSEYSTRPSKSNRGMEMAPPADDPKNVQTKRSIDLEGTKLTWEVRVVVHTLTDLNTCWWVDVASEEGIWQRELKLDGRVKYKNVRQFDKQM